MPLRCPDQTDRNEKITVETMKENILKEIVGFVMPNSNLTCFVTSVDKKKKLALLDRRLDQKIFISNFRKIFLVYFTCKNRYHLIPFM